MIPYFRLSNFYFFYFSLLGVLAPFLSLYLEDLGFSLLEIGQLVSILMLTKIVAPNVWGYIGDKTHSRLKLVRWGSFMTLITFMAFLGAGVFWQFACALILFSFFWNAIIPQFEVITLHNLAEHKDQYSRVRLWGSIGFVVSVAGAGVLFDVYSVALFPWVVLVVIFCIWLASLVKLNEPEIRNKQSDSAVNFYQALRKPAIMVFFLSCFLLQLSHGSYYAYFSLYLNSFGYGKSTIGLLWALGVFAEVLLFMLMHKWFAVHSVRFIMILSLTLTSLRWFLLAHFVETPVILIAAQIIHAFSFGAMHASAIKYVHATFGFHSQGRAQALYSSIGFGAGGGLGVFASGYWVSEWGYAVAFEFSACAVFMAVILVSLWFPRKLEKMTD